MLPGPLTIPPVLLGLWIWSTEFEWAHRFFRPFKEKGKDAWAHAKRHPVSSTVLTVGRPGGGRGGDLGGRPLRPRRPGQGRSSGSPDPTIPMTYVDQHTAHVDVPAGPGVGGAAVASAGDERFYAPRALWRARGGPSTRLLGGPGHRITGPGRPLEAGDAMDFWEVVEVHPPTRLRIRALTRLPGTAFLDMGVHAHGAGSELTVRTDLRACRPGRDGCSGGPSWPRTRWSSS